MREKLTRPKTVVFAPQVVSRIQEAADEFDVSFSTIIRECVDNDLPRLIDRERKRRKRRTK